MCDENSGCNHASGGILGEKAKLYWNGSQGFQTTIRETQSDNHEYYEGFKVKGHVIQSEIQAYFEGCLKAWNVLIDLVRFVEKLSEEKESGKRRHVIDCHLKHDKTLNAYEPHEEKRNQLELKEPVFKILLDDARAKYNQSQGRDRSSKRIEEEEFKEKLSKMEIEAWYEVKHVIVQRKDNIITYILHTRPKPTRLSK